MGKRKVEIKRIEDKNSRQVSFCKRRNGLMEKARQLSVLCDSSVALVIVSDTGKVYSSSSGASMAKIIERYKALHADDLNTLNLEEEPRNYISQEELLEIIQSKLEEANADDISMDALNSLEEQFKAALSITRARKTELMKERVRILQEKGKLLREQNKVLASQLTKMEKKLETECEIRAMSPGNSSVNNSPETLSLLK